MDDQGSVLAHTVTGRAAGVDLSTTASEVVRGETRFSDLPAFSSPALVAGACGAHVSAYYEASTNSNADGARRTVFGNTSTGSVEDDERVPCPNIDLPVAESPPPDPTRCVADSFMSPPGRSSDMTSVRARSRVNALALTAAGVELVPETLSLHPQDVAQYLDD